MNKIVFTILLLSSFIPVVAAESMELSDKTRDPFEKANYLYDQSKWQAAAKAYDSVFEGKGIFSKLSKDAIKEEAASYDMTSEQLIRGHVNYGDVLLALREFLQAFAHRQYRQYDGQFGRKVLENELNISDMPDIEGKTILVYSERAGGAFGDTFVATFLLPWLQRCGAKVIFVPQKPLRKLYSTTGTVQSTYIDKVVVRGDEIPDHDFSTYLWSLFGPYVKEHGEGSFPIKSGWISGKEELPTGIQEKLGKLVGKLLIGFWWRSAGPAAKAADYRSLDRDPGANRMFEALRGISGVKLISLGGMGHRPVSQEEYMELERRGTLENLDPIDITTDDSSEIVTFDPKEFDQDGAFVDTTSVMQFIKKNKGVLVGCDTGLLNLAAAIGEKNGDEPSTFAILNSKADMRWGAKKGRREWELVNGVKVFQCPKQGNWEVPLGQVREEIEKRVEKLARKQLS